MTNKKLTLLRLGIFLLISFLPFLMIVPMMNAHYGEPIFKCEEAAAAVYALGVFGMLIPSVAHLITRLVTKEGFANSYLGINIKGSVRWYIAAILVKPAEAVLSCVLVWVLLMDGMSLSEAFTLNYPTQQIGTLLLQAAFTLVVFFPAFGEEWGWRGYMMPKLTELMPKPAAVIVGGVIWGLWHAPLTVSGHNFGTDIHPLAAILMMCVFCTLTNAFLTLLTERTKSVYPASFCHMMNNNMGLPTLLMLFASEAAVERYSKLPVVSVFLVELPVPAVTAVISMVLLMKKRKTSEE